MTGSSLATCTPYPTTPKVTRESVGGHPFRDAYRMDEHQSPVREVPIIFACLIESPVIIGAIIRVIINGQQIRDGEARSVTILIVMGNMRR